MNNAVIYNTVIRRIFKSLRYTLVRDVIEYIGSKPCDILLHDRRSLYVKVMFQK